MALAGKVNNVYWELENLEKRIYGPALLNPKFQNEVYRLKGECHRLHWDATHVDNITKQSRVRPTYQINDIERRIYLFRNEMGFVKDQLYRFYEWEKPPAFSSPSSALFSSPSNSGESNHGSPGSPVLSGGTYSSYQSSTCTGRSSQGSSSQGSSSQGSSQGSQCHQARVLSMFNANNVAARIFGNYR